MSQDWYLMTSSNQLSGFEGQEFQNHYDVFDEILAQSPEAYTVNINGISKQAIIQSTETHDEFKVLCNIGNISLGDIIDHNSKKWIVVEYPNSNRVYERSIIKLCNNTLSIVSETEGALQGYDSLNRPVYGEPTTETHNFPCVVQSIKEMYQDEKQINIVDGRIALMIQNTDNPNVEQGEEFTMYGNKYRIYGFDMSLTVGDKSGILIVLADKIK